MKNMLRLFSILAVVVMLHPTVTFSQCNPAGCTTPIPMASAQEACILPSPHALDCYYGATDGSIPVSFPPYWCTTIENNHFFAFTADATEASFNISCLGCNSGNGIQAAILETQDCVNFNFVSPCLGNIASGTSQNLTATGIIPGANYYLMIDGSAGAQCDYAINGYLTDINGPTLGLCIPSSPNAMYTTPQVSSWNIDPPSAGTIIGSAVGTSVNVEWLEPGHATLCVQNLLCPNTPINCVDVQVGKDVSTQEDVDLEDGSVVLCAGKIFTSPGTYIVTLPTTLFCDSTVKCVVHLVPVIPPWPVDTTGSNHTIILPQTLASSIQGMPLHGGDFIGVFYDSAGTAKCGGYGLWKTLSTAFAAYGNEALAPAKNGFNSGEVFSIKIWRPSTSQEFDAYAQYAPVGTLGLVTHTDAFADDGISMITSLTSEVTHAIPLNSGWNMISSYLLPDQPNMEAVFAPILPSTDLVKDGDGNSYFPSLSINGIGNWNLLKGYQVKANQKDTLVVVGQRIVPEANPIPLQPGWQIISYLRDTPQNIDTVFKAIKSQIQLVKDNFGKTYSPLFGFNTIGNMLPGQGYKVNALSNTTLGYVSNFKGSTDDRRAKTKETILDHFVLANSLNTGNNATIVLTSFAADGIVKSGDEIGVFTQSGILCGAGKYQQGENLAITVWGDDLNTPVIQEGMQGSDAYRFKVWDLADQKEYTAATTLASGANAYMADAIEVIVSMELGSVGTHEWTDSEVPLLRLFPNPASEKLNIDIRSRETGAVTVTLLGLDGKHVLDLKKIAYQAGNTVYPFSFPAKLPAGLYWFKFQFEKGVVYRQVFLQG